MSNQPAQPSLFGIPMELRLRIYEHLLRDDKPLPSQAIILLNPRLYRSQPKLARTCHQAHAELKQHQKHIVLKTSTFKFRDEANLRFIVNSASTKTLGIVSSVHIDQLRYWEWSLIPNGPKALVRERRKLAVLSRLPKLERLCIKVALDDRVKGVDEDNCWMLTAVPVRDRHYQQVVDDVIAALPALPSGVLLEVQCSMKLMAERGWTDYEDREVSVEVRQRRDEEGVWSGLEVEESHDRYFAFLSNVRSQSHDRQKGVWHMAETLLRRK